jgi:hypothetical protein
MVKKNDVFRTKMIDFYGIKLWKLMPYNDETIPVFKKHIKRVDRDIMTEKELVEYTQDFAATPIPRNGLQWEIQVCENYYGDGSGEGMF